MPIDILQQLGAIRILRVGGQSGPRTRGLPGFSRGPRLRRNANQLPAQLPLVSADAWPSRA